MNLTDLKDLVPHLELCKLIPSGEFDDSLLAWIDHRDVYPEDNSDPAVVVRSRSWAATSKKGVFPAPTFEEIIRKIRLDLLCGLEHHGDFYVANRHIGCFEDKRAATAALKFYFKLKGIEYNTSVK